VLSATTSTLRRPRARRVASILLLVAGSLTLLVAELTLWARDAVFDTEGFTDNAVRALDDEEVRALAGAADIVAAFVASGLERYAYAHPQPGAPWPTLGELVERDERLLVLVENAGGAAPGTTRASSWRRRRRSPWPRPRSSAAPRAAAAATARCSCSTTGSRT
jgi:hypothetical protein